MNVTWKKNFINNLNSLIRNIATVTAKEKNIADSEFKKITKLDNK